MTHRKEIDKHKLYAILPRTVVSTLGASRLEVVDDLVISNLSGVGTPSYRREASDLISKACADCLAVCYVITSAARPDQSVYNKLGEAVQSFMVSHGYPEGDSLRVQPKEYGLHIRFLNPLGDKEVAELGFMLSGLMDTYAPAGKPLRYLVTSPGGHLLGEHGVAVPTEIRGAPEILTLVADTSTTGRLVGKPLSYDEVVDFCIVLHHPSNKDIDAMELIELLDGVGGSGHGP